jgi:hypothetical protein
VSSVSQTKRGLRAIGRGMSRGVQAIAVEGRMGAGVSWSMPQAAWWGFWSGFLQVSTLERACRILHRSVRCLATLAGGRLGVGVLLQMGAVPATPAGSRVCVCGFVSACCSVNACVCAYTCAYVYSSPGERWELTRENPSGARRCPRTTRKCKCEAATPHARVTQKASAATKASKVTTRMAPPFPPRNTARGKEGKRRGACAGGCGCCVEQMMRGGGRRADGVGRDAE